MPLSPIQRFLRRFPPVRRIAFAQAQKERARRRENRFQYHQTIMATLGTMVVTWAGVERLLDELIAWYQQNHTDLAQLHPRELRRKLDYLKKMQRDPMFTPETAEFLLQARIKTKKLEQDRHDVIHGYLQHKGGPSLIWHSQRIEHEGPNARVVHREFHNNDLIEIMQEMRRLVDFLAVKVWVITRNDRSKFPMSDIENALRELGYEN